MLALLITCHRSSGGDSRGPLSEGAGLGEILGREAEPAEMLELGCP